MTIPGHRRWVLWHIGRGLRRSDPHLAAMLAIFVRLTAGEAITSIEQSDTAHRWIRRSLARLGRALAAAAACTRRAMRRIGLACADARSRFRGGVRRSAALRSENRLPSLRDAGPDQPRAGRPGGKDPAIMPICIRPDGGLLARPDPVQFMVQLLIMSHQVIPFPPLFPAPQGTQERSRGEHAAGRHDDDGEQNHDRSDQPDQPPSTGLLRSISCGAGAFDSAPGCCHRPDPHVSSPRCP